VVEATAQLAQPYPKGDPRDRLYDAQVSNLLDGKVGPRQVTMDGVIPFQRVAGATTNVETCQSAINWRFVTMSASTSVVFGVVTTSTGTGVATTTQTTAATSAQVSLTHNLGRTPVGFFWMGNVASTVGISSVRTNEWNATRVFFDLGTSATSDPFVYSVVLL